MFDPEEGDEQLPLTLFMPEGPYSWPTWEDLIAELDASPELRTLVLAAQMDVPTENLLRAQHLTRVAIVSEAAREALK
jgi:hypothetical protein